MAGKVLPTYFLSRTKIIIKELYHFVYRFFLLLVHIAFLFGSFSYIFSLYTRWQNNPVVIHFGDKPTMISEIPFPAITICPLTKATIDQANVTQLFLDILKMKVDNWSNDESVKCNSAELCMIKICFRHIQFQALSYLCFDWSKKTKREYDKYYVEQNIGKIFQNTIRKVSFEV